VNPDEVQKKIFSVLRKGDEQGLHIHGWRSLFESAGVSYKYSPSWTVERPTLPASSELDYGHDVPISSYSTEELRTVIQYSLEILKKYDFMRPFGFRAGGWMATPDVLKAIQEEGFLFDSSAVPPHLLKERRKSPILHRWLEQLWPNTLEKTQPYVILPEEKGLGPLWEVPDNGCLADYMTGEEMLWVFQQNWKALKDKKLANDRITVSIGFHQETAAKYLPRISEGLKLIGRYCRKENIKWGFGPLPLEL
jgi:hypothetical protein